MGDLFKDNDFIPDNELEDIQQNLKNEVLKDFVTNFEEESDEKIVSDYRNSFEMQINSEFEKIKNENRSRYEAFETMKLKGKGLLSDQELLKFKENVRNDVIRKYENVAKQGISSDIKDYIYENVADPLLIYRPSVSLRNLRLTFKF
jgi:hypothetical protein